MNYFLIGFIGITVGFTVFGIYIFVSDVSGYSIQFASGNSMQPAFGYRNIEIVKEVENVSEINVGDVVIYRNQYQLQPQYVEHRVIGNCYDEYEYFEIKGDNNTYSECVPIWFIDYKVIEHWEIKK